MVVKQRRSRLSAHHGDGSAESADLVLNWHGTVATQHGDELTAVETVITTDGVNGLPLGTKIGCIAVGDVPASDISPDLLPEAEADRIFILAHRWALDTAEDLALIAEEGGEVVAGLGAESPPQQSLVAMKLQSAPKRRAARAEKAGGDYLDLFRLTSHPDMTRSIAEALRLAPHDLGSWCQREIRRCMIDEADRTVGTIVIRGGGIEHSECGSDATNWAVSRRLAMGEN